MASVLGFASFSHFDVVYWFTIVYIFQLYVYVDIYKCFSMFVKECVTILQMLMNVYQCL